MKQRRKVNQSNYHKPSSTILLYWLKDSKKGPISTREYLSHIFYELGFRDNEKQNDSDYKRLINSLRQASIDVRSLELPLQDKWNLLSKHLDILEQSLTKEGFVIPSIRKLKDGTTLRDISKRNVLALLLSDFSGKDSRSVQRLVAHVITAYWSNNDNRARRIQDNAAAELRRCIYTKGNRLKAIKRLPDTFTPGLIGQKIHLIELQKLINNPDNLKQQGVFLKSLEKLQALLFDNWFTKQVSDFIPPITYLQEISTNEGEILSPVSTIFLSDEHGEKTSYSFYKERDASKSDDAIKAHSRELGSCVRLGLNLLPWASGALNPIEQAFIKKELKQLYDNPDPLQHIRALILALWLATGKPLDQLIACPLGPDGEITLKGAYIRTLNRPETAYEPDTKTAHLMMKYTDTFSLTLPTLVTKLMVKVISTQANQITRPLGEWLNLTAVDAKSEICSLLDQFRKTGWQRIKIPRIENALAYTVGAITHDPVLVYVLAGRDHDRSPMTWYYRSYELRYLQPIYQRALQNILGECLTTDKRQDSSPVYIGSHNLPSSQALQKCISSLIERTNTALIQDDFIKAHNVYTAYSLLMLLMASGHRPVHDMFAYLSEIDTQLGLCIINDKIITQAHANRLVCLPDMACQQLEHYLKHLEVLMAYMSEKNHKPLAFSIYALTKSSVRQQPIPLFFWIKHDGSGIEHVTGNTLAEVLSDDWPFKLNTGRHLLARTLWENELLPEIVNVQMGHMDAFKQPFGKTSIISPVDARSQLAPVIDRMLESQGWQPLPGLTKSVTSYMDKACNHLNEEKCYTIDYPWGHHRRKLIRKQHDINDKNSVDNLVKDITLDLLENDPDLIQTLFKLIEIDCNHKQERQHSRQRLLWDRLRKITKKSNALTLPPRYIPIKTENSPFTTSSLEQYRHAATVRSDFADYLKLLAKNTDIKSILNKLKNKETKDSYSNVIKSMQIHHHALIVITAAFEGGIAQSNDLKQLIIDLHQKHYVLDSLIFVDIQKGMENEKQHRWRWFPDKLGKSLLWGYSILAKITKYQPTSKEVQNQLVCVLAELNITTTSKKSCDTLAELSRDYWRLHLPGVLREIMQGEISHQPLPTSTLVRIQQEIGLVSKKELLPNEKNETWMLEPRRYDEKIHGTWRAAMNDIVKCFKKARKTPARGVSKHNLGRKKILSTGIKNIFNATTHAPLKAALLSWAYHLSTHGTLATRNLAFNTTNQYWIRIARALMERAYQQDFLNFTSYEYETLYLKVLDQVKYKKIETQQKLEYLLLEFHHYLTKYWYVPKLENSLGHYNLDNRQVSTDANLITDKEFNAALDGINHHPHLNDDEKLAYNGLIILGYRFKLRIDEAFKLMPRDIQQAIEKNLFCSQVRRNVQGDVKTDAALRITPNLHALPEKEAKILIQLCNRANDITFEDLQAGIFTENRNDSRILLDRYKASKIINEVLRNVTGDPNVHFHHLRHSGINIDLFGMLPNNDNPNSPWNIISQHWQSSRQNNNFNRQWITGRPEPSSAILSAEVIQVGHTDGKTLLRYYWHFADCYMNMYAQKTPVIIAKDKMMSFLLVTNQDTIRKERNRKNIAAAVAINYVDHLNFNRLLPPPPTKTCSRKVNVTYEKIPTTYRPINLRDLDLLLTSIRKRDGQTLGLAEHFLISDTQLDNLIKTAYEIEYTSEYSRFGLVQIYNKELDLEYTAIDQGWWREQVTARKILDRWDAILSNLNITEKKQLLKSLQSWKQAHRQQGTEWIFSSIDEIKSALPGLMLLGLKPQYFTLVTPKSIKPKLKNAIKILLSNYALAGSKNGDLPMTNTTHPDWKHHRLGLRFLKYKQISNSKLLNRLLFILSVKLECDFNGA